MRRNEDGQPDPIPWANRAQSLKHLAQEKRSIKKSFAWKAHRWTISAYIVFAAFLLWLIQRLGGW